MVRNKIGQFLFVIGFTLLVMYISTHLAGKPELSLLLAGIVLIILGVQLKIKGAQPPPSSPRFYTLKRILRKNNPDNHEI